MWTILFFNLINMEQINKNTKLLLIFVILLLLVIAVETIVFKGKIITLKKSQQSLSQKLYSADTTVCKTCGVNDIKGMATLPNNSYADFIDKNKIKTYQTPDRSISFSYPQNWKVNVSNWQSDGVIGILTDPNDASVSLNISKFENNAVTIEDRINDAKKESSSIVEKNNTINGSEAIILETPLNNLGEGGYDIFFKKNGYYVEVAAPKTGYALLDFPIEYLLSTIKIK